MVITKVISAHVVKTITKVCYATCGGAPQTQFKPLTKVCYGGAPTYMRWHVIHVCGGAPTFNFNPKFVKGTCF